MCLLQFTGQSNVLRPIPSGELDPSSASGNQNELDEKDSSDQEANGKQKDAVDVPSEEAAHFVPNHSPQRKKNQHAANREFGDVSAIVFLRSVEHGNHLSPRLSGSRDPTEYLRFGQLCEAAGSDYDAHIAPAFECVDAGAKLAQPEMLHGMCVHGFRSLRIVFVKTEESPLPIIQRDRAVWIRAFRNHELSSLKFSIDLIS